MGNINQKMSVCLGFVFYTLGVQYPVRFFHRLFGDRIWKPLAVLTAADSWLVGKAFKPFLSRGNADPIQKARRLIDAVEGAAGIHGEWEIRGTDFGIKRISSCPYACRWGSARRFCPTMGEIMGQKSLEALFPGKPVRYTIKSTLAEGGPRCEYEVDLR